jgi:hypothetical protein
VSRGRHTFRQADVVRLIKAARAAGEGILRVEMARDGRIIVVTKDGAAPTQTAADPALEKWLNED